MTETSLLRWRCRRGMKELDRLLEAYLIDDYHQARPDEQEAFRNLLALPDPELFNYLLAGVKPNEKSLQNIVNQIIGVEKTLQ